jgi:hypothetical protein
MQRNKFKQDSLEITTSSVIFLVILGVSIFVFPLLAVYFYSLLGRVVGNFLFFYPQVVMLSGGLTSSVEGASKLILSETTSRIIAGVLWVGISFVFGYLFHRVKFRYKILLVLPIAVIIVLTYSYLLYFLGISIYLEGP